MPLGRGQNFDGLAELVGRGLETALQVQHVALLPEDVGAHLIGNLQILA